MVYPKSDILKLHELCRADSFRSSEKLLC